MPDVLYSLHGLTVSSQIELGLEDGNGPPDVIVLRDRVADRLEGAVASGVLYEAAPGAFRLGLEGVAKYLATGGNRIAVDVADGAEMSAVAVFLLGPVMAALLHQRGVVPLHASAIEMNRRAVAFTGHSGSGKSTLAAAFHRAGYRVVADDVVAVRVGDAGRPLVSTAAPALKLWADSLDNLGIDGSGLAKTRAGLDKSLLPLEHAWNDKELPLHSVYVLEQSSGREFELSDVEGQEKMELLLTHTYRRRFLEGLGNLPDHFRLSAAFANHVRMVRVVRPREGFELERLVALIGDDLESAGPATEGGRQG